MARVTRYKNLSSDPGVEAFEIGRTFIKIKFRGHERIHVYDTKKPGRAAVEEMKQRARAGRGLATFVAQAVQERYARIE